MLFFVKKEIKNRMTNKDKYWVKLEWCGDLDDLKPWLKKGWPWKSFCDECGLNQVLFVTYNKVCLF